VAVLRGKSPQKATVLTKMIERIDQGEVAAPGWLSGAAGRGDAGARSATGFRGWGLTVVEDSRWRVVLSGLSSRSMEESVPFGDAFTAAVHEAVAGRYPGHNPSAGYRQDGPELFVAVNVCAPDKSAPRGLERRSLRRGFRPGSLSAPLKLARCSRSQTSRPRPRPRDSGLEASPR
jgi:hypothetical protein